MASQFSAWWGLSQKKKQSLQNERLAGRFGGQNAAAVGRAPYVWVQEGDDPAGAAKAGIEPLHFMSEAAAEFDANFDRIVSEYLDS